MAHIFISHLVCIVTLLLAAQVAESKYKTYLPKPTPTLAESTNNFAFVLHRAFPAGSENIAFSPWSLSYALGMLCLGASGATLRELQDGMFLGHMRPENIHYSFKQLREHLVRNEHDYEMTMFSTILVQERSDVSPVYKLKLQRYYDAIIHDVDFVELGQLVTQWVNVWTSLKTGGKITDVMTTVPSPDTLMLLVTVNYFKGVWQDAFNASATVPSPFINIDNTKTTVDMMFATRNISYYQGKDLAVYAVDLSMKGDIGFLFLMPERFEDFKQLESNLSSSFFEELYKNMYDIPLEIGIPKFKASSRFEMRDALKSLGINTLFSGDSDLSQISSSRSLYVQQVIHKAAVEVNEQGAEASSVNVVSVVAKNKAEKVVFNRPFIFLIRDKASGLILFMGRVTHL